MKEKTPVSLQRELEDQLRDFVVSGANHVLKDIVKYELDVLASRDPSFESLAKQAKELLVELSELAEQGIELKVFDKVSEYASILDSISSSIVDRSNDLLTDCITHLQEFVEINGQKGE